MRFRSKILITIFPLFILAALATVFLNTLNFGIRNKLLEYAREKEREELPLAVNYGEHNQPPLQDKEVESKKDLIVIEDGQGNKVTELKKEDKKQEEVVPLPKEEPKPSEVIQETVNLNIPFTSQAPSGNWDLPFKEACEEASILMVNKFYEGRSFVSAAESESDIKKMVEFEESRGLSVDMDAEETAKVMKEYLGYQNVRVVYDITVQDIKKELSQGKPVIVPAAGRMLGNPYYRQPGPPYHMLVVKGYTSSKFITNDPGTRHGKDFTYDFDTFYNAIHDWNNGNVEQGRKAMIVVDP